MSIGQVIPPFADNTVAITNATSGNVGQPGQILVGFAIVSSTAGTITIATTKLGTILTNYPLVTGFNNFPLKIAQGDQLTLTGGGTFVGAALFGNP